MEVIGELLERAEVQGYVTTDDILDLLPEAEESLDQLEEVFILLNEAGVEVYDERIDDDDDEKERALSFAEEEEEEEYDLASISSDDTVGLYLKEMARVPLLSLEEEVHLAKTLETGRKSRKILSNDGHDPDRRAELERLIEAGRIAREHLIKANTRLVVSIAKKYMGRGVPFHPWLPLQHVCHVVDSTDDHAGDRRPGADDSRPGPYVGPHPPPV